MEEEAKTHPQKKTKIIIIHEINKHMKNELNGGHNETFFI